MLKLCDLSEEQIKVGMKVKSCTREGVIGIIIYVHNDNVRIDWGDYIGNALSYKDIYAEVDYTSTFFVISSKRNKPLHE